MFVANVTTPSADPEKLQGSGAAEAPEQLPATENGALLIRAEVDKPQTDSAPVTPELPTTPGCYAWLPFGCPRQGAERGAIYAKWQPESKGSANAVTCKARGADLDKWCASTGAQMVFVPVTPESPGCYAWRPWGCTRQ